MSAMTASPAVTARTSAAAPRAMSPLQRRAALALLVSAQFVVMLDTSIVNVALPSIQHDLGLTPAGVAWVANAYVLTFGGLLLLAGRAADACSSPAQPSSPSGRSWLRRRGASRCSWPLASSRGPGRPH